MKILNALEFDQALLAHVAFGVGGPLKNFKGEHFKIGLKIPHMSAYNFGGIGRTLTKPYQRTWLEAGVIK